MGFAKEKEGLWRTRGRKRRRRRRGWGCGRTQCNVRDDLALLMKTLVKPASAIRAAVKRKKTTKLTEKAVLVK